MIVTQDTDLTHLREIGRIVADTLQYMMTAARAGMNTWELDQLGAEFLKDHGAQSAPVLIYNFPGATCISVNEHGAHGIPKKSILLKEGDLINIDVSAEKNGFFADTGASFVLEPAPRWKKRLCQYTHTALQEAIDAVTHQAPFQSMARAVEKVARRGSCKLIPELSQLRY